MRQVLAYRLGSAVTLFTGSLIPFAPAEAQTAVACVTTACMAAQQSQLTSLLAPFTSLPGTDAFSANFRIEGDIYRTSTTAQRVQAARNATLAAAQTLLWEPDNNPSPLSANVLSALANGSVMAQYNIAYAVPHTAAQPTFLKGFGGYTMYNTYGLSGPYGVTNIDPHPFQTTPVIWANPWTSANTPCPPGTAASECPVAAQVHDWTNDVANATSGAFPSAHMIAATTSALTYAVMMPEAYQDLMHAAQQFGLSRNIIAVHYPTDIIGGRIVATYAMVQALANNPSFVTGDYPALLATTAGMLRGAIAGGVPTPYAGCAANVAACIAGGVFPTATQFAAANLAFEALTTYGLPATGPTNLAPVVPLNAELLIATRFPYLTAGQRNDVLATTGLPSGGALDDGTGWARLNLFKAAGGYGAFTTNVAVTLDAARGGFNAVDLWSNDISGPGGLTKGGSGLLILGGTTSYTGGTVVSQGTLALTGTMVGDLTIQPGAQFVSGGGYSVAPGATLTNAGTFQSVSLGQSANASLINNGIVNNSGSVLGGLVNNGVFNQISGTFTSAGMLGGTGTINGRVVSTGTIAPGNSIGTLTINGQLTQANGSIFQVEANAAGQADRIVVTGAPGTASVGGSVQVTAAPGVYAPRTAVTILTATGGVSGTYAGVGTNFPFLQASLGYDPTSVTLTLQPGGFRAGAATANQSAVGAALDAGVAGATGDFATVIGTMATLGQAQGQATMTALSGQNYAGFSTAMVQTGQLFMSNFSGQTGGANRINALAGAVGSSRTALAEACDVACETTVAATWGVWGGALGAVGSLGGTNNAGTTSYNAGGFAAGLDRQISPELLVGVTLGYASGNQWTSGFLGRGWSDTVQAGLYAGYTRGPIYVDALAGYAHADNRMVRQISIPGLAPRTATGSTGANQFFGQIEGGYRLDIGGAPEAYIMPFARLQGSTATQNGFTESGAGALDLFVAAQTTNSLRSVLGAQLGGTMDLGWRDRLAAQFRLGWSHEFASTARPVTAAFVGAPALPFTTYGAAPDRNGIVLGFSASTSIGERASVHLRYEGEISGRDNMHAGIVGVRFAW